MNRRALLTTAAVGTTTLTAGCLDDLQATSAVPEFAPDNHEAHLEELEAEIERREVEPLRVEYDAGVAAVEYESESLNDDLAEVAMAFVERVQGGWELDRLEALAEDDAPARWHAEAEWARQYLDGEIEAGEYGNRISNTMERTLVLSEADEDANSDGNGTDD